MKSSNKKLKFKNWNSLIVLFFKKKIKILKKKKNNYLFMDRWSPYPLERNTDSTQYQKIFKIKK